MKRYYLIIALAIMGLLHACTNETDLIFDKPASERMKETLDNYQKLLTSKSNGWLVEYYPQASQAYGGYNLFFNFTEKEVTVKSEIKSSLLSVDEATSVYKLGEDMGPTLNFDTYNEVLNFFSDPALPIGGGDGFGFEGDYEFVFMSGNESEVILRGKKSKNTIRLTPFTSTSWQKYCDDMQEIKSMVTSQFYTMEVNGKAVKSITKPSSDYSRFVISYDDDNVVVKSNMSYVVTPTGIRFYEPLTVDGVVMQEFSLNKDLGQLVSADGKAVITPIFLPAVDIFMNSLTSSRWYFSSSVMGSGFLNLFNSMKTGMSAINYPLYYAWIGASATSKSSSFSYGALSGTSIYLGSELLTINKVVGQDNQITIVATGTYEANGKFFADNAPQLKAFTNSLAGTYIVSTKDSKNKINTVILTDPMNANRIFTLSLDQVIRP